MGASDLRGDVHLKKSMILFLIFAALSVGGAVVLFQFGHLKFLTVGTANIAVQVIRLTGLKAIVFDDYIILSNQSWHVTLECTAIYLMGLFWSFILVYPVRPLEKLIGIALGVPIIFMANVLRLMLLAAAVKFLPGYFQVLHDYVWQVVFIFLVVTLWFAWIQWLAGDERQNAIPA